MYELIPGFLPAFFIEMPLFVKVLICIFFAGKKIFTHSLGDQLDFGGEGLFYGFLVQILGHNDNSSALLWVGGMLASLGSIVSFMFVLRRMGAHK